MIQKIVLVVLGGLLLAANWSCISTGYTKTTTKIDDTGNPITTSHDFKFKSSLNLLPSEREKELLTVNTKTIGSKLVIGIPTPEGVKAIVSSSIGFIGKSGVNVPTESSVGTDGKAHIAVPNVRITTTVADQVSDETAVGAAAIEEPTVAKPGDMIGEIVK